jgi:hypothetical protein
MLPILKHSLVDLGAARFVRRSSSSPMDPVEELYRTGKGQWLLRTWQGWTPEEASLSLLRDDEAHQWLDRNSAQEW